MYNDDSIHELYVALYSGLQRLEDLVSNHATLIQSL